MKQPLAVLAILLQSCSVGTAPEMYGTTLPDSGSYDERHEAQTNGARAFQARPSSRDTCITTLASAGQLEDGSELSAFLIFNAYPPSEGKRKPGEVEIESVEASLSGLMACMGNTPFEFKVLVNGELKEGEARMISPLTAWKIPGGYLAFYLHMNYEDRDGEGESVEVSGILFDTSGTPIKYIQEVSSWYEYEGSVRIRNFYFSNGEFIKTEEVFDPKLQDQSGNVLDYIENPNRSIIKVYSLLP